MGLAEARLPGERQDSLGGTAGGRLAGGTSGGGSARGFLECTAVDAHPALRRLGALDTDAVVGRHSGVLREHIVAMADNQLDITRIGPLPDRLEGGTSPGRGE